MVRLIEMRVPDSLVPHFAPVTSLFGDLTHVVYAGYSDHWITKFFSLEFGRVHFEFAGTNSTADDPLREEMLSPRDLSLLRVAITEAFKRHRTAWGDDIAIVLRQHAYLLLGQWLHSGAHYYFPMPGISAHELLEDQARLEREFPGTFQMV